MQSNILSIIMFFIFLSCVQSKKDETGLNNKNITDIPNEIAKVTSRGGRLSVDVDKYDFGIKLINTLASKTFTFNNTGSDSLLDCEEPLISGDDPDDFSIAINGCDLTRLSRSQSCDITIEANAITPGLKKANLTWKCRDNKISIELKLNAQSTISGCPDGYIFVPADVNLASNPFCVMKYEAKNDKKNNAISTAEFFPWTNIQATGLQGAKAKCQDLGDGFDLISNQEWMAIARNIEKKSINWDSKIVGTGHIFRGNAGKLDDYTYAYGKVDFGTSRDEKAKHILSTGEAIWDFSGNVYEYVDWGKETNYTPPTVIEKASCNPDNKWQELTLLACSQLTSYEFQSYTFSYDSSHGIGQVFLANKGFAIRGGSWSSGFENAGIYNLNLSSNGEGNSITGFRCVYRPE